MKTKKSTGDAIGTFEQLVGSIQDVHGELSKQASQAVNICLTLRNWLIGLYILEYEQEGADRAQYGKNLFQTLSSELEQTASIQSHPRELRRCRGFYTAYPEIRGTLSPQFNHILPKRFPWSVRVLELEIAESGMPEDNSKTGRLVREIRERYITTYGPDVAKNATSAYRNVSLDTLGGTR